MSSELRRQNIADLLRRSAARYPNRVAIVCAQTHWTYAQFSVLCDRLAAGLAAVGIAPSDRVAVLARNSHAFAALRFAVARLGAVLVPVNFMLSADEARYMLQHSGARMLCVDSGFAELGKAASVDTAVSETVWLPGEDPTDTVAGLTTFDQLLKKGQA